LFGRDRLGDALAHLAGTAAALRGLAAGPENVDWAASARPDGGIDIAFPNGPTVTDVHRRTFPCRCESLAEKIRGIRN
jgi:hypothetical protein